LTFGEVQLEAPDLAQAPVRSASRSHRPGIFMQR
jgi:hypothetical protein